MGMILSIPMVLVGLWAMLRAREPRPDPAAQSASGDAAR
jgi:prolipoprotein diacylglyceryltransferase